MGQTMAMVGGVSRNVGAERTKPLSADEWEVLVPRLRELWDLGWSTNKIGRELSVSKNAIVGKIHRLGLSGRPSPIIRDGRDPARARDRDRKPRRVTGPTLPPLASIQPEPAPDVAPIEPPTIVVTVHGEHGRSSTAKVRVTPEYFGGKVAPTPSPAATRQSVVARTVLNVDGTRGIKREPVPIEQVRAVSAVSLPMTAKCQWPLWNSAERPTHKYCDAAAPLGSSWCHRHHAVVYKRVRDRRDDDVLAPPAHPYAGPRGVGAISRPGARFDELVTTQE